jgi:uncharacterized protein YjiS (DUF1127 family)
MLPKRQFSPSSPVAMSRIDRAVAALLSSFIEGFALFAMLHLPATSGIESYSTEAKAEQPEKTFTHERRRYLAIVSSSTRPEVTGSELKNETNRTGSGSGAPSADAGRVAVNDSSSFEADRSDYRNWLTKPWSAVAGRWQHWHHEREIKQAVATLVELDDRTLRDIGISHRSLIEHAARYGRNGLI